MTQSAFGIFLAKTAGETGIIPERTAQIAGIDHAYIYRLETGEKESPSEEALTKLIRAFKAPKREADMLRYLADNQSVSAGLAEYALEDQTVSPEELKMAAHMAFRGTGRPDLQDDHRTDTSYAGRRRAWMNSPS